jgi:hypothetical protein
MNQTQILKTVQVAHKEKYKKFFKTKNYENKTKI